MEQKQQDAERPFGIYAIITLQVLSILTYFGNIISIWLGNSVSSLPNVQDVRVMVLFNIVAAAIMIGIIAGLWRLKYWAWYGTMITTGLTLIGGIWQYFNGDSPYVELLISSLIVLYLNQRELRQIFESRSSCQRVVYEVSP